MRAFLLRGFREPLGPVELERPRASAGRAVVRVLAAGVCYRDFLMWQGFFPKARLPIVPGHEFAGVVEEVGEGVVEFKPGDRVAGMMYEYCGQCEYCRSGREYLCKYRRVYGEDLPGAFAEYISTDVKSLARVPPTVPLEAASFAACVLSTVVRGVRKLGPARQVLVTGAGGGVGIHAVQVAKAMGARVIAVTSAAKAENVAKFADYVVTERAFSEEVKKLGGVDGAVEAVGSPTLEQTIRSLNWGGRVALIGNIDPQPAAVALGLLILKEIELLPVIQGGREDLEEALRLLATGAVRPVYTTYGFSQLPQLLEETPKSTHLGRRVLTISPP
ncbi:MAG: alcohol dehydrogenase catalytic domain-containing protein [Pyrobaculum sp.]